MSEPFVKLARNTAGRRRLALVASVLIVSCTVDAQDYVGVRVAVARTTGPGGVTYQYRYADAFRVQRVYRAEVEFRVKECVRQQSHMPGVHYRLRLSSALDPGQSVHRGVGVVGHVSVLEATGEVALRLEPREDVIRFSTCASTENIHLFAWAGRPRSGIRVWHRRFALDYELEPDCTDADVPRTGR
jgi:hypothetical protein